MNAMQQNDAATLSVQKRTQSGKGAARKIRITGIVPAVFYGLRSETVNVTLNPAALVKALQGPRRRNTILFLESDDSGLNGKKVMIKEIQRHPITRAILHVDLMEVYSDRPVKAMVPIVLHGHPKGVDLGGTLDQHLRTVELKAPPEKIPASLAINVEDMDIGDAVKLSELTLGDEVELLGDLHAAIASVAAPRVLTEETPAEEGAEAAEGEAAEGGEKAPSTESPEKK